LVTRYLLQTFEFPWGRNLWRHKNYRRSRTSSIKNCFKNNTNYFVWWVAAWNIRSLCSKACACTISCFV